MWCGAGTGSWSSRPWRSRSVLRGESATTYASSKLNRVGRRAARYDSGLSAHRCTRPARKRPAPHRIAHERIACSRSRCGNFTLPCKFFLLPPVNSCQHPSYLPLATPAPPLPHNHARYDQLNRITSALTTSNHATSPAHCWGETYTLDAWANLNSIATTTNSAYTGCSLESGFSSTADGNNHLPAWGYDASGNSTSDGTYSYIWNGESQLKSSGGVNYLYDGDGRRVSKVGSKLYWYGSGGDILAETNASGATTAEYIFFGGKRVAMLPAGGNPIYYVEDLLGTSRVITTNTGVVCYDADFYPYGGERSYTNSCPQNNYKFEGKERDTETGNDDFGARYYSNRFGRWLSADWSAVPAPIPYSNLTNPQTLNLYSMVADDPETFADLDGHDLQKIVSKLERAANNVGQALETAGQNMVNAVTNLVSSVGGEIGAGAGQVVGGLSSGDYNLADEGTNRIGATVAPMLITDGESAVGATAEEGEFAAGEAQAAEPHPSVATPYERPSGATTTEQRAAVQGKPCVDCGKVGDKMVANHKTPLVKEYYKTGKIDTTKMRSKDSVNSQCPTCSAKQGAQMSQYSKEMKAKIKPPKGT